MRARLSKYCNGHELCPSGRTPRDACPSVVAPSSIADPLPKHAKAETRPGCTPMSVQQSGRVMQKAAKDAKKHPSGDNMVSKVVKGCQTGATASAKRTRISLLVTGR
mgnify:CR=1 FL=1